MQQLAVATVDTVATVDKVATVATVVNSGLWTALRPCCIVQVLYSCEHDHLKWSL
jgi:hypothetical protein